MDNSIFTIIIIVAFTLLQACTTPAEPQFETRVSVPVNGEVIFH